MQNKLEKKLNVGMFGHKRVPSCEGGIEIVVEEMAKRMVRAGHQVTCYNRADRHMSGAEYDAEMKNQYKGIRLKKVSTIRAERIGGSNILLFCNIVLCFWKIRCESCPRRESSSVLLASEAVWKESCMYYPWCYPNIREKILAG